MSPPRSRTRTYLIAVALTAVILALTVVVLQGRHFHDFYLTVYQFAKPKAPTAKPLTCRCERSVSGVSETGQPL